MRTERREGKGPSWGCTGEDTLGGGTEGTGGDREGLNKAHRTDGQTDRRVTLGGQCSPLSCAGQGWGQGLAGAASRAWGRELSTGAIREGKPPRKKLATTGEERRGARWWGQRAGLRPCWLSPPQRGPQLLQPHSRPRASFLPVLERRCHGVEVLYIMFCTFSCLFL